MAFKPVHLYEALTPTILLSMCTGTLPFHLSHQNGQHKLVITKTAKSVTICYMILYSTFIIDAFTTPTNLVILDYYQSVVSNLGLIFELIGGIILIYVIYSYNLIHHESLKDIFVKFAKVDQNLMQFHIDLKYTYIFYYQLIHIVSGSSTLAFTAIAQYANAQASGFVLLTFSLRNVITFPLFIIFVMETQYTCLATLANLRFEFINDQLAILREHISECSFSSRYINVVPIARKLATKSVEYAAPSPVQRLETLMYLHDALCDIIDQINFNYGLQVIVSITLKFIITVFSIFYCYWSKVIKGRTWSSVFWFVWACYNLYELLNLSVSCQKATTQARYTGVQVHKLLLNATNPALKEKLNIFSQQLVHRRVKFTALDLFTIDASLLLSIISSGSTYLIIMLQFQESTEGQKYHLNMKNTSHVE